MKKIIVAISLFVGLTSAQEIDIDHCDIQAVEQLIALDVQIACGFKPQNMPTQACTRINKAKVKNIYRQGAYVAHQNIQNFCAAFKNNGSIFETWKNLQNQ